MARKKKKQINKIIMNREEQIDEASVEWYYNEAVNPDIDDAFKAGAKYAYEHLSEENKHRFFDETEKWLNERMSNCEWIDDIEITEFMKKLKDAIFDKL
jgi:hypothetical protein